MTKSLLIFCGLLLVGCSVPEKQRVIPAMCDCGYSWDKKTATTSCTVCKPPMTPEQFEKTLDKMCNDFQQRLRKVEGCPKGKICIEQNYCECLKREFTGTPCAFY